MGFNGDVNEGFESFKIREDGNVDLLNYSTAE